MFAQNNSPVRTNTLSQTAQFFNTISNSNNTALNSNPNSSDSQEVQFAPNFLFGNQQPSNRRSFGTPNRQVTAYGSPSILKHRENALSAGKNVHWSPVLVREKSRSPEERLAGSRLGMRPLSATNKLTTTTSLWNGPPLRSLNEVIIGPPEKVSRLEDSQLSGVSANGQPFHRQQQELESAYLTEMDALPDAEDNLYWVTVFGFASNQLQQILELFSKHGDIMAHKTPTQGNWVHIRYSSPVHAQQALTKNASIFQGHMIGVVACKDREALDDETAMQNTTPVVPQRINQTMNGSSSLMDDSSFLLNGSRMVPSTSVHKSSTLPSRSRLSMSSRAGMRPLNASVISDGDPIGMESSFKQNGPGDDSFIGKLWNIFTNSSGTAS